QAGAGAAPRAGARALVPTLRRAGMSGERERGDELARAEAAGWAAVRAAGLDETADGAAWQAVFFAAQRAALARGVQPAADAASAPIADATATALGDPSMS